MIAITPYRNIITSVGYNCYCTDIDVTKKKRKTMLKTKNILYPLTVATILALSGCGSSDGGATGTTVSYIGQPPVAYAGVDITVGTGEPITLDGSGSSDPDGNLVSYEWRASSGEDIKSANPILELDSLPIGVYIATLIVTDDQLNTATDTMTITVTEATAPVANAGADQTIKQDDDLHLDGSASRDIDGTITKYEWYDITNPTATTLGAIVTITNLAVGVHTIELKVTDDDGYTGTDRIVATVVELPSTLKKTGQTSSSYANDDGAYQTGVPHSYTRDNSNDTVTDNVTGLMWQDDIEAAGVNMNWADAGAYCTALGLGGLSGWRLPTIDELYYIIDKGRSTPAMDPVFQNVASGANNYWSSTVSSLNSSAFAWGLYITNGSTSSSLLQSDSYYVRCVR